MESNGVDGSLEQLTITEPETAIPVDQEEFPVQSEITIATSDSALTQPAQVEETEGTEKHYS